MGSLLRNTGLGLIALWLVLLLLVEALKIERPSWHGYAVSLGLVMLVAGCVVTALGRAQAAVKRRRCVRCSHKVLHGQVYCAEHFKEAVDKARDQQRERLS